MSAASRREQALSLADELLGDIESARLSPADIARKTSRLARWLDDGEAMAWLSFETMGYPTPLTSEARLAAIRSNRIAVTDESGQSTYWTGSLGRLQADLETARTEHAAASALPPSSAQMAYPIERERAARQNALMQLVSERRDLIDRIVGSIHGYAALRFQELRFGAAVESAFEVVRSDVDQRIGELVPDALPKLSAAFENATSDNPENWANAAGTCRRLLKAAADALQPPGEPVEGRTMDDDHYINRLVHWIKANSSNETAADLVIADLEYLGHRLSAVLDAGHKGIHAEVGRLDASRFITGTYLLLGDVLRLASVGADGTAAE